MAGRKNLQQQPGNLQQPASRPLPLQPSSSNVPNSGAVPWQSVVLGENVAYVTGPEPPPPSYEETKSKSKTDSEYDYIDNNQRVLTSLKVQKESCWAGTVLMLLW